jgi:hypothetical protein
MLQNSSRLCSCYRPDQILDYYSEDNLTDYATTTTNISSVKYIPNDNTLIVFNSTIIRKLAANNLSIILRNLTASPGLVASVLYNDTKIYVAFASNRSINMFDLNLTLLQTSMSWGNQSGSFGGMFLFNNQILIMDTMHQIIWSINSLNQSKLNVFFNFSSYNIINPNGLFIYQNQSLYIPTLPKYLFLFNLPNFTLQQVLSLSVNVSMFHMSYDSNCDRLWFGTSNYTYAPVLDLALNQLNIYQTQGNLSKSGIFSIDFDSNYTIFYADAYGYVHRIYLPYINC